MKNIKLLAAMLLLGIPVFTYAQSPVKINDVHHTTLNTIRFTPSYQGYSGLGFKLNYERALSNKLIGFASAEGNLKYNKALGIGLKFKLLKYKKIEGLIGLELQHVWNDNSSLGFANTSSFVLNPSFELRYNLSKSFFIGIDATQNFNLGNNNFQNHKNTPRIGLSVGFRF